MSWVPWPIIYGVVGGLLVSTLGYLKNRDAKTPFEWKSYFETVFAVGALSGVYFFLIEIGIPGETLLVLAPVALREYLKSAVEIGKKMVR